MNTGNNLLFLIVSALLGFMASSGILGRMNITAVTVRICPPDEIYDGLPAPFAVEIINRGRRPLFLIRATFAGETFRFFMVSGGDSRQLSRNVIITGRGDREIGEVVVASPFPVNFFVRINRFSFPETFVVFPAPKTPKAAVSEETGNEGGAIAARHRGIDGEIVGIGEYTGSEPLKLVHWRLTARHDTLKVQERAEAGAPPVVVDVAALPGPLEERLSVAAGIVNAATREGRAVGLRLGRNVIPPGISHGHRLRLLTELARYDAA